MDMKALFIYRAPEHSPNNVERDAAILDAVGEILSNSQSIGRQGQSVLTADRCSEHSLPSQLEDYDLILHMARRLPTLVRLEHLKHPRIINAPQGVRHVAQSRELTLLMLQEAGVPIPNWWAFDPEADEMFLCEPHLQQLLPAWVKAMRPDGALPNDVCFVESPLEADTRIMELAAQSVPDIIVTQHLEGDLLKCYYVSAPSDQQSPPFLYWFYPQESGYSKFGNAEQHNTPLARIPVTDAQLLKLAQDIGTVLGLHVFGFDAIVQSSNKAGALIQPTGEPGAPSQITIIDVNDWPSFSPCRQEAAQAIARLVSL